MKNYTLSLEIRQKMATMEPHVKGAIIEIAHRKMGIANDKPRGIFKCEGGIKIAGKEIAIRDGYVKDDWTQHDEPSAEEIAVAEAVEEVGEHIAENGSLEKFEPCKSGDPLRSLISV